METSLYARIQAREPLDRHQAREESGRTDRRVPSSIYVPIPQVLVRTLAKIERECMCGALVYSFTELPGSAIAYVQSRIGKVETASG